MLQSNENDNTHSKIKRYISDTIDISIPGTASIIGGIAADSLLGQLLPGITTGIMSYKQKRFERNIKSFIREMNVVISNIEDRLSKLESTSYNEFRNKYLPTIFDYVWDEAQEDKIKYIVNGILYLSGCEDIKEDFVLSYYDTLKQLRIIDIKVLKIYNEPYIHKNITLLLDSNEVSYEQYQAVEEKLCRLGLLQSDLIKNLNALYGDFHGFVDMLNNMGKGRSSNSLQRNSKNVRNIIKITRFGENFLKFFVHREG